MSKESKPMRCPGCDGTGFVGRFWPRRCPTCKGHRMVIESPGKYTPAPIDTTYPRHLAKLVREILADEEKAEVDHSFTVEWVERPTVEVPIELIRDLATKAWMRNDIATADLLYGLLGEKTATAHEMEDL